MKNVLETNAWAAVISSMNAASQIALAKEVAARGKQKRDSLEQSLTEKINDVDAIAREADRKAGILDDFEKGQLEEALKKLVQTEGMQAILDAVCVDLGSGNVVSLKSVILALANADKIVKTENTFDSVSGELAEQKYTLSDDSIVLMAATKSIEESGDIRFDVAATGDAKWKGVDAGYYFIIRPVTESVTIEGQAYQAVKRHDTVEHTNIVLDITGQLVPCGGHNTDVDLNEDGVIGNVDDTTDTAGTEGTEAVDLADPIDEVIQLPEVPEVSEPTTDSAGDGLVI